MENCLSLAGKRGEHTSFFKFGNGEGLVIPDEFLGGIVRAHNSRKLTVCYNDSNGFERVETSLNRNPRNEDPEKVLQYSARNLKRGKLFVYKVVSSESVMGLAGFLGLKNRACWFREFDDILSIWEPGEFERYIPFYTGQVKSLNRWAAANLEGVRII